MQSLERNPPEPLLFNEMNVLQEIVFGEVSKFICQVCRTNTLLSIESAVREAFRQFFVDRGDFVQGTKLELAIDYISVNKPLFYQFGEVGLDIPGYFRDLFSNLNAAEVKIVFKWHDEVEEVLF